MIRHATALAALCLFAAPSFAQDAMAPAQDAMGAMAPAATISDEELALCLEQAANITFPEAKAAADAGCHGLHQGMDVMGALKSLGADHMGGDAMGSDAMGTDAMGTDAMGTDAMAPKQ